MVDPHGHRASIFCSHTAFPYSINGASSSAVILCNMITASCCVTHSSMKCRRWGCIVSSASKKQMISVVKCAAAEFRFCAALRFSGWVRKVSGKEYISGRYGISCGKEEEQLTTTWSGGRVWASNESNNRFR